MNDLRITVHHDKPAGQGALSRSASGHTYHSNGKLLKPWRKAIALAGRTAAAVTTGYPVPAGPISVEMTITVPITGAAARAIGRTGTAWPSTRFSSDVDHHARAVLDALTGVLWKDDSQVVELIARKVYPDQGIDALPRPGAVIIVRPMVAEQTALPLAGA